LKPRQDELPSSPPPRNTSTEKLLDGLLKVLLNCPNAVSTRLCLGAANPVVAKREEREEWGERRVTRDNPSDGHGHQEWSRSVHSGLPLSITVSSDQIR
jgi:hypothetical protein